MRQHPLHQEWLEAQAQAAEYRRLTAELNAYANPNPANKAAAQKVRETLAEKRIASLEKQITKLKALQFTVDHGEEA